MIKILHLTYDFATINEGKSTVVINDLVSASSKYLENYVVSLKRTMTLSSSDLSHFNGKVINLEHFGLPFGIFLKTISFLQSKKIFNILKNHPFLLEIDAIHAHKLTFEGFIGYKLSKILKKRIIISIRQTDFFVLKYRPDLIPLAKNILNDAVVIFYIAPYMISMLRKILGEEFINAIIHKFQFLPNPINFSAFENINNGKENYYLTILWLNYRSVKRKNLMGLFRAIKLLNDKSIILKIIGKGNYEKKILGWIKNLGLENQIELLGFKENLVIKDYLAKSKGLLLPSFSETFGVVYAESLLCGVPILYSRDTGFDGIFENVGYAVNPHSIISIAEGIKYIDENNDYLRSKIHELKETGSFEIFRKENVALKYYHIINEFIK